jgi:hypothetical protein
MIFLTLKKASKICVKKPEISERTKRFSNIKNGKILMFFH